MTNTNEQPDELAQKLDDLLAQYFNLKISLDGGNSPKVSIYRSELASEIMESLARHTKEAVEAARIDENRLSQRCFDGMTGAPGDQFSKHFARLIERGFELAATEQKRGGE